MMRREFLELAQKAALTLCANNDPTEYFNALSNTLGRIEGDKPMWTSVYEAYLSLHGVGNRTQDVTHARMLINKALEAYNTPVYLEQFEMLILAVVLTDYKKVMCEKDFSHKCRFFKDQQATTFESQGIHILDETTRYYNNSINAYIAHQKLAEIYAAPIIHKIIRNPELAKYHYESAQYYLAGSETVHNYSLRV